MAIKFIHNITQFFRGKDEEDVMEEGAKEKRELLEVTMNDDELIREIDKDVQNAMPLYREMKRIQDDNEAYYLGEQLDKSYFSYEIPTAENLLYMATETIVSIITAKRREPIVIAGQDTDESRELSRRTQQFLSWKWSEEDMQIKFEDWVRHSMLSRISILKIRWDLERDDYEINVLRPGMVMIDKDATSELDAKFIIEFREDTLADLIEMFPKAAGKLKEKYENKLGTKIKYLEYWTNEFVVWKVNEIVLAKIKNPNWNWDEDAKTRKENLKKLKKRWIKKTRDEKLKNVLLNFFNEPRKPYIILSLKSLNKSIYADTSDFEQGKVVQDIINRTKRLINKAIIHALGREVYSGSYISNPEAKKSIANPNSPIWLESGKASDAVTHIGPKSVSPILTEDLQESKRALDNVMGTHGTTRGERGAQETARGRTILREGDMGRIDLSVRRIDKKLELLYGWMLQMAKVYYTEDHFVKMLGSEGAASYLRFSQNDIEDGQEIIVKSELTADKATQREVAAQRMGAGQLDPLTMFEKFDEPNPKELTRKLVYYLTDPKLYIQTFASDENAEGAENDPLSRAKQENKQLLEGEKVPLFEMVTPDHLQEHAKFAKSSEFQNQEVDIKQNFQEHIKGELKILKQTKV